MKKLEVSQLEKIEGGGVPVMYKKGYGAPTYWDWLSMFWYYCERSHFA